MSRRGVAWLVGLCLLAGVLRLAVIDLTHATLAKPEENRLIAANLASGRGFTFTEFGVTGPTAIRGPLYPAFLALVGPDRVGLSLACNAIVGAAGVAFAFLLARRLALPFGQSHAAPAPSPWSAWVVAGLFAVWPTQLYAATLTQGLVFAITLTLAAIWLAVRGTPSAAVAAGVTAGLASLAEPALALPLLLVALVVGRRISRQSAALFVLAGFVIVSPWLYRNWLVFGRATPITNNFWREAFLGNGPDASGSRIARLDWPYYPVIVHPPGRTRIDQLGPEEFDALKRPEPQRLDVMATATSQWLAGHPWQYLKLCGERIRQVVTYDYPHANVRHPGRGAVGEVLNAMLMSGFAVFLCTVRRSVYRSIVLWLAVGLFVPMVFVMTDVRMLPLLHVPLLLAVFPPVALLSLNRGQAGGGRS